MRITSTRTRPAPLVLGLFFTAVTARVLFDDLITGTGPLLTSLTTAHALTLAALVGAIAAGHFLMPAIKARAYVAAIGLVVLFVAATGYTLASSGMRNAEVAAAKIERGAAIDAQRADAKQTWQTAKTELDAATAYAKASRAAADAECATGKRSKCDGKTTVANAAESLRVKSSSHERLMRATLNLIPVAASANVGTARLAGMLADLGLGHAGAIERTLAQVLPFAAVVIAELATIVFLGLAFPAHTLSRPTVAAPVVTVATVSVATATVAAPRPKAQPLHPVITALRQAGRAVSNDELARAMGVTKGEATKRRAEVAHMIIAERAGRHLMIRERAMVH